MTYETFLNQRKSERLETKTGIALTPNGVCQIVNLNKDGISFKCIHKTDFPIAWSMDIYDVTGPVLDHFQVKKVWENSLDNPGNTSPFSVVVGGEFHDLSAWQQSQLNNYLLQLLGMEE